jgi:hypothetical protein
VRRVLVLGAALVFIAGFGFLTVTQVVESGFGAGTVVSALILAVLAVGIIGALRNPPAE